MISDPVEALRLALAVGPSAGERPFVTLAYAQSLDGSISLEPGHPMAISGPESSAMTHRLRAMHDGILIGIGTLIADNPRLTARLASGPDPQPVVLDGSLRCPLAARLLARRPWLLCGPGAPGGRQAALEAAGARVLRVPAEGGRLDLPAALAGLRALGIGSLMVEGGGEVITSFLQARLADYVVVTVAPLLAGGYNALRSPVASGPAGVVPLSDTCWTAYGADMVVGGTPQYGENGAA